MSTYQDVTSARTNQDLKDEEQFSPTVKMAPPEKSAVSGSVQGSQGDQVSDDSNLRKRQTAYRLEDPATSPGDKEEEIIIEGLDQPAPQRRHNDILNSTQTNALLNIRHNKADLWLQSLYQSPNCQYFYLALLTFGCVLIVITIVDGFRIASSPMFILLEFTLNLTISVDLGCRVKMAGFHAFMRKNKLQNKLDFLIVISCNLLFLVSLLDGYTIGEISDELLLVVWSVMQTLRILMIARNQKKAIEQAKFLINFTDIGIETEQRNGLSLGGQQDIEEEIVFEDHPTNQGGILQGKPKKPKKSIEMQDFR